ncbi:hypothetical protein B4U79_18299 [Dinothrombium tinctorium]|uniref:Uncharacterized protein n=1 Tax=Dinothrombium tinctorium TaxID=1965070 RepID=A0A3S3RWD4_9ACAR|nr:hypothetical protein B4U79_18299 [Dinothrombium tinctorium]
MMIAEYVNDYQISFTTNTVDENNVLRTSKHNAFAYIGFSLHLKFDCFRKLAMSDEVKRLLKALGYKQPTFYAGLMIQKHANHSYKVRQYQDAFYDVTEPVDSPLDGGCMQYVPGSHISYPVRETALNSDDESLKNIDLPNSAFEKVPVEAGSMIIHNSLTIHRSSQHLKPGFIRRAATLTFYDRKLAIRKELPYLNRINQLNISVLKTFKKLL